METPTVFKRYDIRGKYPQEIDDYMAFDMGKAAGTLAKDKFKEDEIVLGYDNRESSNFLRNEFIRGVLSTGVDLTDIGYATSDMVAYAGKYFKSSFSVCITASHLEWNDNGFKFRYRGGNGFLNNDLANLKNIYMNQNFNNSPNGKLRKRDFTGTYQKVLLKKFSKLNRGINSKIVFDSGGGPSSLIVPEILEKLGAEVIEINKFNEKNRHPNPKEENL
ncbi:MAG: hypothetical protein ABEK36_04695, partial [Candidatus Aenigmatarchaeota archaeon]